MSIINAIFNNTASSYADAFKASDRTSQYMQAAISMWFELYFDQGKTDRHDPCQQIPFTIVRKLSKAVFSEYEANSKDRFAKMVLDGLGQKAMEAIQMAMIGGACLLKPIPAGDRWRWMVVHRANILVFGRSETGELTDIGTAETTTGDKHFYTLLERRRVDHNGFLTIENKLYRSDSPGTLGRHVPLKMLPQYAELPEEYTFPVAVGNVGMVEVKMPMVNCVDGSADGVSIYAPAVELIRNINSNEAQLNGEFERGESRIIASADMLRKDPTGKRSFSDTLFVGLDDDPDAVGITIFSPELREASFLARQQAYLKAVENVIGLKRGLLSEVEAVERTAKEITSSEGEYNLTVLDLQGMWEQVVRDAVRLCAVLGQMYRIPGAHDVAEDDISISWGDGVLFNPEQTYLEMKEQVSMGLLQPERLIGWYYNLPSDTPEQRKKIRDEYMPELDSDGEDM